MTKKQKRSLYRIILSFLFLILANIGVNILPQIKNHTIIHLMIFLIPYLIIGYDILMSAFHGVIHGHVFDENFLMAVATIGAIGLGLAGQGDYNEASMVMILYQTGELFQSYALGQSRKNIGELMDIRPDHANLISGEGFYRVDPGEVKPGTIIAVYPGERIPIDGIVKSGNSTLNTAALTGESKPKDVCPGDIVYSGCINQGGLLKIETTKEFEDSTASRILDLVENAGSRKSRPEKFITRFSKYYTPAVCISALILGLLPPLALYFTGYPPEIGQWIYRALTFLVISCPCALVISIPLSFFAALGCAGKNGILIKGSNYLERLGHTDCILFDKTGTLTEGSFKVNEIHGTSLPEDKLLEYAVLAESTSTHPISKSLKEAWGKSINTDRISHIKEIGGYGVVASVDNLEIAVGSDRLMDELGIKYLPPATPATIVYIAINKEYSGYMIIADRIKETAPLAISELKSTGITHTVMLTGDDDCIASDVASKVGIREFYSRLLPKDKVDILEKKLKEKGKNSIIAFVGDGINDAPAISRADIGIAMGALGSDAALEAADVVIMDDDPGKIAKAITLSRNCMKIVYQNIIFSLIVKFSCLILGALGITSLWIAIFADVGVMILAVLNALRCMFIK